MKEFSSTEGGRHIYNEDFKNLQELALSMTELFKDCGGNFVISGCKTSGDTTVSVTDGYVYLNGRICKVAAASGLSSSNLYIVPAQKNGGLIDYADGSTHYQYVEYYAVAQNAASINVEHITYDSVTKAFPNLATVFFNHYVVTKDAGVQAVDTLTVNKLLKVVKVLSALEGVQLGDADYGLYREDNGIRIKYGKMSFLLTSDGYIKVLSGSDTSFSIVGKDNASLDINKVNDFIKTQASSFVPVGTILMWANADSLPDGYMLCDGRTLTKYDYPELAKVLSEFLDDNNTFTLPDLRGRFIVGYNSADDDYSRVGNTGGEVRHKLITAEMPAHKHDYKKVEEIDKTSEPLKEDERYSLTYPYNIQAEVPDSVSFNRYNITDSTEATGGGQAHENRPPYYVLAYIIKVK